MHRSADNIDLGNFIWDDSRQQLIVLAWPEDKSELSINIEPGIYQDPDPLAKNN